MNKTWYELNLLGASERVYTNFMATKNVVYVGEVGAFSPRSHLCRALFGGTKICYYVTFFAFTIFYTSSWLLLLAVPAPSLCSLAPSLWLPQLLRLPSRALLICLPRSSPLNTFCRLTSAQSDARHIFPALADRAKVHIRASHAHRSAKPTMCLCSPSRKTNENHLVGIPPLFVVVI